MLCRLVSLCQTVVRAGSNGLNDPDHVKLSGRLRSISEKVVQACSKGLNSMWFSPFEPACSLSETWGHEASTGIGNRDCDTTYPSVKWSHPMFEASLPCQK